ATFAIMCACYRTCHKSLSLARQLGKIRLGATSGQFAWWRAYDHGCRVLTTHCERRSYNHKSEVAT
ncbi:MAG: hypothetical protein ACXVCM_24800, partial [Ktedonobacteraceae bacterium]